jgi:hypothetical protein
MGGVRTVSTLPLRPSVDQIRSQVAQTGASANTQGQCDTVQKEASSKTKFDAFAKKPSQETQRVLAITPHGKHSEKEREGSDEQKRRKTAPVLYEEEHSVV